jgi:hypothetical protein
MKRLWLFAMLLPLVTGCAANVCTTRADGLIYEKRVAEDEVAVLSEGEQPSGPYQILGSIFAEKRGTALTQPKEEHLVSLMKEPASEMGADALVGVHSSNYWGEVPNTIKRWAGALAVRFLDAEEQAQEVDFIVVVPPVINMSEEDAEQQQKDNTMARMTTQYYLEKLGYYSVLVDESLDQAALAVMSEEELDAFGGKDAALVLLLALKKGSKANIGIAAGSSYVLSAELFSKGSREIVWENEGTGSSASFGLVMVLAGGQREAAIASAVKKLFDPLAPRRSGSSLDDRRSR